MTEVITSDDQSEIDKFLLVTAAAEGDLESIKRLLFERKVNVNIFVRNNTYTKQQTTPLLAAAMNNRREVVRYLLENGANIWHWDDPNLNLPRTDDVANKNRAPLHWRSSHSSGYLFGYGLLSEEEMMKLQRDPYLFLCDIATGMHPIHFSAIYGDVVAVTLMLDLFETQKRQHQQYRTNNAPFAPPNVETKRDNISGRKRRESLVDVADNYGLTPLHWAAWAGQLTVMKVLIERGASPHSYSMHSKLSKGVRKLTPLHMCCMLGNTMTITDNISQSYSDSMTLVSRHQKQNGGPEDEEQKTSQYLSCVQFLVNLGADVIALDGRRMTPIHYCVNESNVAIFDFLIATLVNKCNIQPKETAIQYVVQLLAGLYNLQPILRYSDQKEDSLLDLCEQNQIISKSIILRDLDLNALKVKLQKQTEEMQKSLEEANSLCSCQKTVCQFCFFPLRQCQMEDHQTICCKKTVRKCPNYGYGCTFVGSGTAFFRHFGECQYSSVVCFLCLQLFPRNRICTHYHDTHFATKDLHHKPQRRCILKELDCNMSMTSSELFGVRPVE
jgi:ankyrin repeat protein